MLGDLSSKLLKTMRKGAKRNKDERDIRLSLLHSLSESDALSAELTHIHQTLTLPDPTQPSAQLVTAREGLFFLSIS